jgi:hypothetical protein
MRKLMRAGRQRSHESVQMVCQFSLLPSTCYFVVLFNRTVISALLLSRVIATILNEINIVTALRSVKPKLREGISCCTRLSLLYISIKISVAVGTWTVVHGNTE